MGRPFRVEIDKWGFRCRQCKCLLGIEDDEIVVDSDEVVLISNVFNVVLGPEEEHAFLSDLDTLHDLNCVICGQIVGWKYVRVHNHSKLKEGQFLLMREMVKYELANNQIYLPNRHSAYNEEIN